jgi:tRNA A37 threonylcarbamoyladenosine dehydratase
MTDLSTPPAAVSQRRFGGIERLYGSDAARRIAAAHVAVVGIGGVGSWTAEALARSGVGRLTLVDLDHVAESNINRQVHALEPTLGMAKVQAMRERIAQIHPQAVVQAVEEFVDAANVAQCVPADAQVLIDACDQTQAKAALIAHARATGRPCFTSGAAGGKRLAHRVEVADLASATHDPLLASVRQRLRKLHAFARSGAMGVQAVFSREPVSAAAACDPHAGLACAGYGSSVNVTATFGFTLAALALEALARAAPQR